MDTSLGAERQLAFVIPARNEEHYVRAALDSVATQRHQSELLEVVVVENGSRDATFQVAREYAVATPQLAIRVVC